MKLQNILQKIKTANEVVDLIDGLEIEDIAIDSRLVKENSIFFALSGTLTNGAKYIPLKMVQ
jgi:UDP-N-acetylmuramyl tripeptide synthase